MSRGPKIGHNNAREARIRELVKMRRTRAGQAEPATPPSQKAMREAIEAALCPWCAAGPYKNLAGHTYRAHGVSADEFREMAGLTKHQPVCSQELSESLAEERKKRPFPEAAREAMRRKREAGEDTRTFSKAGKKAQRQNILKAIEASQEERRRNPQAAPPDLLQKLHEGAERHREERFGPQNEEILRLARSEEPMTIQAIADKVGVRWHTVQGVLRRNGLGGGFLEKRWENTTEENRKAHRQRFDSMREVEAEKRREETKELVRQFVVLGSTFEAIRTLAARHGVKSAVIRERLKRAGVRPPDGRASRLPKPPPSCGTTAAYQRHLKRGEEACSPCKEARSAYMRDRKKGMPR